MFVCAVAAAVVVLFPYRKPRSSSSTSSYPVAFWLPVSCSVSVCTLPDAPNHKSLHNSLEMVPLTLCLRKVPPPHPSTSSVDLTQSKSACSPPQEVQAVFVFLIGMWCANLPQGGGVEGAGDTLAAFGPEEAKGTRTK